MGSRRLRLRARQKSSAARFSRSTLEFFPARRRAETARAQAARPQAQHCDSSPSPQRDSKRFPCRHSTRLRAGQRPQRRRRCRLQHRRCSGKDSARAPRLLTPTSSQLQSTPTLWCIRMLSARALVPAQLQLVVQETKRNAWRAKPPAALRHGLFLLLPHCLLVYSMGSMDLQRRQRTRFCLRR